MVETPGHSTDLEAIADGYVAVSPLHLDLTHERSLETLGARFDTRNNLAAALAAPCAGAGGGLVACGEPG